MIKCDSQSILRALKQLAVSRKPLEFPSCILTEVTESYLSAIKSAMIYNCTKLPNMPFDFTFVAHGQEDTICFAIHYWYCVSTDTFHGLLENLLGRDVMFNRSLSVIDISQKCFLFMYPFRPFGGRLLTALVWHQYYISYYLFFRRHEALGTATAHDFFFRVISDLFPF